MFGCTLILTYLLADVLLTSPQIKSPNSILVLLDEADAHSPKRYPSLANQQNGRSNSPLSNIFRPALPSLCMVPWNFNPTAKINPNFIKQESCYNNLPPYFSRGRNYGTGQTNGLALISVSPFRESETPVRKRNLTKPTNIRLKDEPQFNYYRRATGNGPVSYTGGFPYLVHYLRIPSEFMNWRLHFGLQLSFSPPDGYQH